ncbi:MAG: hypothetical protein ACI9W4_001024 [Rhodothermales bacterium]
MDDNATVVPLAPKDALTVRMDPVGADLSRNCHESLVKEHRAQRDNRVSVAGEIQDRFPLVRSPHSASFRPPHCHDN